ncbi:hypothetical protein R3P38DRAFT_2861487, partial [Favolaschia claudopus]
MGMGTARPQRLLPLSSASVPALQQPSQAQSLIAQQQPPPPPPSFPPTRWLTEPDLPSSGVGAAHFRVSARTGEGVGDVFGWVAGRLYQGYV